MKNEESRTSVALGPMERILVIEDELPMRVGLEDLLRAEGYRVLTACDGEEGLARAVEQKPDLILLDIMLPKLDGFAVCETASATII